MLTDYSHDISYLSIFLQTLLAFWLLSHLESCLFKFSTFYFILLSFLHSFINIWRCNRDKKELVDAKALDNMSWVEVIRFYSLGEYSSVKIHTITVTHAQIDTHSPVNPLLHPPTHAHTYIIGRQLRAFDVNSLGRFFVRLLRLQEYLLCKWTDI